MALQTHVTLKLPEWINTKINDEITYASDEEKISLAIELSRLNVAYKSGGPFGAAIFNEETGALISVGVNRVVPEICSVAHAEIMAYILAEAKLGNYRLTNRKEGGRYVLASSAQPCAMCYGALPWTGVQRLIFAASSEDVERLTNFDEGPLPEDWKAELTQRNIKVTGGILQAKACKILQEYQNNEGIAY